MERGGKTRQREGKRKKRRAKCEEGAEIELLERSQRHVPFEMYNYQVKNILYYSCVW